MLQNNGMQFDEANTVLENTQEFLKTFRNTARIRQVHRFSEKKLAENLEMSPVFETRSSVCPRQVHGKTIF